MPGDLPTNDRPRQLAAAIDQIRAAEAAGRARTPQEWLDEFPDLAAELKTYFQQREAGIVTGVFDAPRHFAAGTLERFESPAAAAAPFSSPPASNEAPAASPLPSATLGLPGSAAVSAPLPAASPADPANALTEIRSSPSGDRPPARVDDLVGPGSMVGEYELVDEIGRGGMGVIYRARHRRLGRIVALKMISAGRLASTDEIRRFRTEAEAAAQLDHPHIVPIYEVGEVNGQPFFTMRLIDGGSLQQALSERRPPFAVAHAVRLMAQVARAVHHAHQRGILHRDLKPGNILLDRQGEPHVTDFGLVKQLDGTAPQGGNDALTRTGAIVGTPSYMSPEQARAERSLTTASDIYSLGAILYELLTGQPPFRGPNPVETLMQVLEKEPPRPRSLNGRLDQDLETICLKCLEKDPAQRYASAASLADDLERWLRREPIQARPISTLERAWRWCRRNPTVATLATAVTLLLISTVIGLAVANAAIARSRDAAEQAAARERELRTQEEAQRRRADRLAEEEKRMRTTLESAQRLLTNAFNSTRAALNKERILAFANRLGTARMALSMNQVALAEQVLDECPTDLLGWEWHYLKRLCHGETLSLIAQWGALHPRDSLLATAEGSVIRLRRLPTGIVEAELIGHRQAVAQLWWTAAGDQLLSAAGLGTDDAELKLWNWPSARTEPHSIPLSAPVYQVALSPDGRWLALVEKAPGFLEAPTLQPVNIVVMDLKTGQRQAVAREVLDRRFTGVRSQLPQRAAPLCQLTFSPDSSELALITTQRINTWSLVSQRLTTLFDLPAEGQQRVLQRAAYLPGAGGLVVAVVTLRPQMPSDQGQATLMVINRTNPEERRSFAIGGRQVVDLQVSGDGTTAIVAAADRTLRAYALSSGVEVNLLRGHLDPLVTLSVRDRLVASTDRLGMVKVWDLDARPEGLWWRQTAQVAFAARGTVAARVRVAYPGLASAVEVRDVSTMDVLHEALRGRFANVDLTALSDGGDLLALVGARGLHRSFRMFPQGFPAPLMGPARQQFTLELWDTLRGQRRALLDESAVDFVDLRFDATGNLLLAALRDKSVRIYAINGQLRQRQQWAGVEELWLSPDGRTVLLLKREGEDWHWILADVRSGEERGRLKRPAGGLQPVVTRNSVAFSPDGQRVAACAVETRLRGWRGDSDRQQVAVWDTRTGELLTTLQGALPPVAFSPNGRRLVSAASEGDPSLRLWHVPSGTLLLQLALPTDRPDSTLEAVQFSGGAGHLLAAVVQTPGLGIDAVIMSGVPLPEALRYERQARQVVREVAAECLIRSEIAAEIKTLPLDPTVRRVALQMVESWPEPPLPELILAAWQRVACLASYFPSEAGRPGGWQPVASDPTAFQRALRWADAAVQQAPTDDFARLVHGAALYRTGRYADARTELLALLGRLPREESQFALLGFLALVEQKLGDADAAHRYATQLLRLWRDQRLRRDPLLAGLFAEVAEVVGLQPLEPTRQNPASRGADRQ